jgi:hypothetical protein
MNFRKSIKRKIELSQLAFKRYLSCRSFASALVLKKINEDALNQILMCVDKFEDDEWEILSELIQHWSGWICQFEVERKNYQPLLNDEFIFERATGLVPWPSAIKQIIINW